LLPGAGAVLNMMQPAAQQSIAVYGVGGVGLARSMAARIAGCDPIIAVDRLPSRLVLTRELGATHTLSSREPRRSPKSARSPAAAPISH
jgi:aryl-alcohol dehydrogenase